MKSHIKSSLFIGFSLFLALLTEHRLRRDCEDARNHDPNLEPNLDPSLHPDPDREPDRRDPVSPLPCGLPRAFPERAFSSATTVIFSGTVVRNGERFALREIAGTLYPLDSAGSARSWEGEDVRVTGKLDLGTRLLHVDAIESAIR